MLTMAAPLAAVTFAPSQAASVASEPTRTTAAASASAASPRAGTATGPEALDYRGSAGAVAAPPARAAGSPLVPSAAAAQTSASDSEIDADQIIEMRALGITPGFKRSMAQAGLPGLTVDQLMQARSLGITPEYVRDMRAAGLSDFEELTSARALRIEPAYIGAMRRLGVNGSIDDYQGMISLGITPDYVRRLRARGIRVTSPDKLTSMKALGFDPDKDSDDP